MIDFLFFYLLPIGLCYLFYYIISIYTPYTLSNLFCDTCSYKTSTYIFALLSVAPIVNIIFLVFLTCLIVTQFFRKR